MNRIKDVDVLCVENILKDRYIIPLYQRNFAWGEEQISKLLQDIYESMCSGDEYFYVGSLIVLQRGDGVYEVIDGQQRLTMLSILSGILDMGIHLSLRYDSRPEVEDFFRVLNSGIMPKNGEESSVSHFFDAIDIAWSTQLDVEKSITLKSETIKNRMVDFIKKHVCLVREIMPNDTDVAAYFEIMNNRGEQLQEHEIIKGLLLGKLHEEESSDYSTVCSKIWDACSQMDTRIQKSFSSSSRLLLFGDNCDSLKLVGASDNADYGAKNKFLLKQLKVQSKDVEPLTVEKIVNSHMKVQLETESLNDDEKSPKEESIIDFPNFLMHVFRLYYNECYRSSFQNENEAKDIPLSEKYLLKVYNTIKQNIIPTDFFLRLLYCRVVFDRYIIKSNVTEDDEKREWVLLKPYIYEDEKRGAKILRFKQAFDEKEQDAIIRSISCLQVSFRAKPYKNYLQSILEWFVHDEPQFVAELYLEKLHQLMISEFNRTSLDYVGITEFDNKRQGTNVPHYLFNFTDYLYWWMKNSNYAIDWNDTKPELLKALKNEMELIRNTDFRFLNRNSIEHHYPQKRQDEHGNEGVTDFYLNCLGNLLLISKSVNSRLSDKNPIDKAALYLERADLPPTRQIVYNLTRNKGWGKEEIAIHLDCMKTILEHREEILQTLNNHNQ
ncbi:MAG: DUF262 domain-containing protein [Phocaeicola sp.]|nr:DUF262 domain-containing HNH endonuclease family protein [Phocaeicola sp.]MDY5939628.1 DUF262 domain-containing protein [Phocaeicola sp.]